jgi:hypothetical protein
LYGGRKLNGADKMNGGKKSWPILRSNYKIYLENNISFNIAKVQWEKILNSIFSQYE